MPNPDQVSLFLCNNFHFVFPILCFLLFLEIAIGVYCVRKETKKYNKKVDRLVNGGNFIIRHGATEIEAVGKAFHVRRYRKNKDWSETGFVECHIHSGNRKDHVKQIMNMYRTA